MTSTTGRPDEPLALAEQHREYFDQTEAVAFNKDQRIVIIGQQVTPEIRQTALFLGTKGVQVTCAEFSFFQAAGGERLLSQEIVVGGEQANPRGRPRRTAPLSRTEFLESCDDQGRAVYSRILDLAKRKGLVLKWGTTCFYIVVDVDGAQEPVCTVGLPASKYGQAFWTSLGREYWGVRKVGVSTEVVEQLWATAEQTGLFTPAGKELKCPINRVFTDDEVNALVVWCESVEQAIRKHAVPSGLPPS